MDEQRERVDRMGDEIAEVAAHIDAATHRMLTKIRAFDEARGWYAQGALGCAHWLSWRIGLSPGAAREKVRVARALAELPAIDAALARGELSYSKVRALTRIATPKLEEVLLDLANHSTGAQLEKICRLYRSVDRQREAGRHVDELRYVSAGATDDGMVRITAVLTSDEAALVMKAVDDAAERVSAKVAESGDASEANTLDRADGLVAMADARVRGGSPERPPVEVVVTTSRTGLAGGAPAEVAEVEGAPVPAETSRRLACDAGVVHVTVDERGDPLDVGRKTRTISPALRRALTLRDGGCAFPGCPNCRFVDGHHVRHWADGGGTKLDNLVSLCRRHHQLVHEGGFYIEADERGFSFKDPNGRAVPAAGVRPRVSAATLAREHAARGLDLDAATNYPRWDGAHPDYDACISGLVALR